MRLTTIDTHQFIKSFTQASKSKDKSAEKQAEVIAKTMVEAQEAHLDNLATRNDLKLVKQELKSDIKIIKKDIIIILGSLIVTVGGSLAGILLYIASKL